MNLLRVLHKIFILILSLTYNGYSTKILVCRTFVRGRVMLDKEILLDVLRLNHSEEVIEVIDCCQFSGKNYLDVAGLNSKLNSLNLTNVSGGLTEDDWFELVYELAPDIYDVLSYGKIAV
jgi:hypothetical protein